MSRIQNYRLDLTSTSAYTTDNMKKALSPDFLIILCLAVFSPFITLSQSGSIQFNEEEKAWVSSHPVLNVGNERYWPPLDFVIKGKAMGYSIGLMDLIAKEIGIEINYVSGLSWSELLEALNKGTIDVLPAISKTKERETYIKFSKPYIDLPYIKVINSTIPVSESINLKDKTLAVIKGSNIEKATISEYPNINIIHIKTILDGIKKVSTGEADIFIENAAVITYYLNESYVPNIKLNSDNLGFLESSSVYIGVLKKNEILGNLIDKGLKAVSKEDIVLLRKKWMPIDIQKSEIPKPEVILTAEERKWISHQTPIKVANSIDWAPFNFSENGAPKGFSIELLQLVGKKTGLPFEFKSGNTWAEILEKFKLGELDLLPSVYFTESRKEFISFTESYASNPSVIVVNGQNSDIKTIKDLSHKKVAVITNFAAAEVLDKRYPNIEQVYVKNTAEGLNAVSVGNVDAFIESIGPVSYLIDKNFIPNVKILGNINIKRVEETQLHFGVAKDSIILRDILQKGLNAVSVDEKNKIRQKWLPVSITSGQNEENFKSSDLWKIIILSFTGFLALIIGIRYILKFFMKEKISLEFGSQRFRTMTMLGILFIVFIISLLGWWATEHNKKKILGDLEINLETTLVNTHERLKIWVDQRKSFIQQLGRDPVLVKATQEILNISADKNVLLSSDALNKVRLFYKKQQDQLQSVGFFIINKDYLNLASSRNENIGDPSLIYSQMPGLISQVFKGNSVFIPPMESDAVLDELQNNNNLSNPPTMFFVTPVQSATGEILAALVLGVDPAAGFSRVMQLARVGETGESYAFNHEGRLLSESRFDDDLRQIGLISQTQQGILQIE
ncbi:MAG: ABC-type amino acid transport substrate-binding protein, partial [Saprospiraceae bacterium]